MNKETREVCCPKCKGKEFKISILFEHCYCIHCKEFFHFDEMLDADEEFENEL